MGSLQRLKAWISRTLGLRPDELGRTAPMFLYLLFVLLAYYILKPVSRALFLTRFDASQLPYLYLAMAASGGVLAYHYSRVAVRWSLRTAVDAATALILISLLSIWQLLRLDQAWIYYVFNIWVSLFSLVLVSQGWLVASNIFDARAAKRVYSLLAAGAVLGAAMGGSFTALVVRLVGTPNLLPASAVFVLAAYGCYRLLLRQPGVTLETVRAAEEETTDFSMGEVLASVRRYRHLQVIVAILIVTYIVDTLVEYQFSAMARLAHRGDNLTAFLGSFYGLYLNIATFVLQIFLTALVVSRFGVGGTLLVMPVGIGLASAAMAISPSVLAAGAARLIEASTRYSFNRTGMELLYLPLPADLRNRVKAFVDIFVDRMARGVGALMILGLSAAMGTHLRPVTVLALLFCGIWACLAIYARREYVATVRGRLASRRLDLESMRIPYQDSGLIRMLEQSAMKGEGRQSLYALSMLEEAPAYPLEPLAIRLSGGASAEARARLYEMALRRRWQSLLPDARREIELPPGPALRPALAYYATVAPDGPAVLSAQLAAGDPRRLEAAIESAVELDPELRLTARMPLEWIREAVRSPDPTRRRLGALAYRLYPDEAGRELPALLVERDSAVRRTASAALRAQGAQAVPGLAVLLGDAGAPDSLRRRAARVLSGVHAQEAVEALMDHLGEPDLEVRAAILRSLERLHSRAPQLDFGDGPVRRQIHNEARAYFAMHAALALLRPAGQDGAAGLLARTLEDRLDRAIARLFQLLGLRYPPHEMQAAYRAVRRGGPADIANALEFLDNILDHDLKRFVLPLLDHDQPPVQRARDLFGIEHRDPVDVLRHIINEGDPWLVTCAVAAAGELQCRDLAPDIERAGRTGGAILMPVATSAIRRLAAARG